MPPTAASRSDALPPPATHNLHPAGVSEEEVESLAGKKEGCDDDIEFVTVMRPDEPLQVGGCTFAV
jgi:hypothetical protein